MNLELLLIFTILSIVNVILQTIKSIATFKCGKTMAAAVNAVAFGLYTVVLVYTNCDLPLLTKALVVAACNFVGVWIVKHFEEKARKDKLWKVEATITNNGVNPDWDDCILELKQSGVPMNYIDITKYILINCYCATQADSAKVKLILDKYHAKYFVSESKTLE